MKSAVSITLILIGVLVVAIPPLSDAWQALLIAGLLEHGANNVTIQGQMGDGYRIACFALSARMIIVGIMGSLVSSPQSIQTRIPAVAG